MNIVTLDIDKRLRPDIIGSAIKLPFKQNSFDVIACFQVLEHLPYNYFYDSLRELFRVARYYTILSLPDYSWAFRFNIIIPGGFRVSKIINFPRLFSRKVKLGGEHYWEIGRSGFPLKKIVGVIGRAGFKIEKTYRVYELPLHRFFKLRSNKYSNLLP